MLRYLQTSFIGYLFIYAKLFFIKEGAVHDGAAQGDLIGILQLVANGDPAGDNAHASPL